MRKLLVALTIIFAVLSTSCGSANEEIFGVTPEEFMQRSFKTAQKYLAMEILRGKADVLTVHHLLDDEIVS